MSQIKKKFYTWQDVETMCVSIVNQMYKDGWKPDYIVGITRGGNVPATIISNMTGIRCEALKVALRDGESHQETNCWMSEDAYGYNDGKVATGGPTAKNILVVDDINDTGATFQWIKEDWPSGCHPDKHRWDEVWNQNVRFATIVNNLASPFNIDYTSIEINKAEEDTWVVFPYEEWW